MSERFMDLILLIFYSLIIVVVGTCPTTCVSCINDTCMKCEVESYLESGSCLPCPAHCTSCNNSVICYNCTEGYYGLSCDKNCISSMCLNNTCNKDSGICLHGCIEGYYLYGLSCYPCGATCKTCANFSNNCLECKEGYYGPTCQYPCSHCKDGICTRDNCTHGCGDGFFRGSESCYQCNEHCAICSHFTNCQICVDGYFGPACQFECTDCSPCNQDGTCPTTTLRSPAPTTTTSIPSLPSTSQSARSTYVESTTRQSYPPTISETSTTSLRPPAPATTSLSSLPSMLQSARTTSVESTTHQSYFPITSDPNNEGENQEKQPMDNTIKYAVGGGTGGLFVIVMIVFVVFVTKRRLVIKRTNSCLNSQERESEGASQDYTTLAMETRQGDGHIYSSLDNAPNIVTTETRSTTRDHSGQETHHVLPQKYVCDTEPGYYSNVN